MLPARKRIPNVHTFRGWLEATPPTTNQNVGDNYASQSTVSLFGCGATGLNGVNPNTTEGYYTADQNLSGNNDWGACDITNGTTGYRTLTNTEWDYLFIGRENASNLYGNATVNGIHGVIILPDNSGLSIDITRDAWDDNVYSESTTPKWSDMESAGVVFLPVAGCRTGNEILSQSVGYLGYYWSAVFESDYAYCLKVEEIGRSSYEISPRSLGHSVRLVKDAE